MKQIFFITSILLIAVFTPWTYTGAQQPGGTDSAGVGVEQPEAIEATLYLFHSPTCPHCRDEKDFLATIKDTYPTLTIDERDVSDSDNHPLMIALAKQYDVEYALGGVPLTFIGERAFVGFRDAKTTGKEIEEAIQDAVGWVEPTPDNSEVIAPFIEESEEEPEEAEPREEDMGTGFTVPFLGTIYVDDFSTPMLAVLLGFLDGFNVCSLGALVLIIGLTLKLQRRKAILLVGGVFIVTTAIVYGTLIIVWAKIFGLFTAYIDVVKIAVAFLALGGGLYFLKEYFRMRKQGAVCEFHESKLIQRLTERTGRAFEDNTRLLGLLGTVLIFAAVVAIVEFPCSAATPLIFAGVLASTGMSEFAQFWHIALFVLFYMLDELLVFGIAAYKLKLWMTNGTFTKYAVLAEAVILIVIGFVFIAPLVKAFGL